MRSFAATPIDVHANRAMQKYSPGVQLARVAWALAWPLFALSPRPVWAWRRAILRLFGARIAEGVRIYPSVRVEMPWRLTVDEGAAVGARAILYSLGQIHIGARATVSQGAHLCAGSHDRRSADRRLLTPPIMIGRDAWICADAFVGPGVRIGDGAVLSARAVAFRDIPDGALATGNPAILQKEAQPCP